MTGEHDDLLERLRAADPARSAPPAEPPSEGRLRLVAPGERTRVPAGLHAVAAARRRHAHQRVRRLAAATTALACAATAAFAVGLPTVGGSGGDSGLRALVPSLAEVAARAEQASRPRARSLLYYRSDVQWGSPTDPIREQRTTVLRYDERGRVVAMRSLHERDRAYSESVPRIVDSTSVTDPRSRHGGTISDWDSTRRRVRSFSGVSVPFIVHRTAGLLRAAERRAKRRGGEVVQVRYKGRRAYRIDVSSVDWPRERGEFRAVLIDAETYAPLLFAMDQPSFRPSSDGKRIEPSRYREHILEIRTLEDTPENRRMLELRGPLP